MTFPEFIRAEVRRLGSGQASRGERHAAALLGVTDRTIRRWASGHSQPNTAEEAGARLLLTQASPPPRANLLSSPIPEPRPKRGFSMPPAQTISQASHRRQLPHTHSSGRAQTYRHASQEGYLLSR